MHAPGSAPFAPDDLLEKRVYDVDGHRLGRVRAVEEAPGGAHAIDVELTDRARLGFREEDIWLGATDIVSAEDVVVLNEELPFVLHPELRAGGVLPAGESR